jgi:hypothetical protein
LHLSSCLPLGIFWVSAMPTIVVSRIKGEEALWSETDARHLSSVMPRGWSFCLPRLVGLVREVLGLEP